MSDKKIYIKFTNKGVSWKIIDYNKQSNTEEKDEK